MAGGNLPYFAREHSKYDLQGLSARLKPSVPKEIVPLPGGFELRYEESYGRFACSVELDGERAEVFFRVRPDLVSHSELSAVRFPPILAPESEPRPVFTDTQLAGRMYRPEAHVATRFATPADENWMRFHAVLGRRSAYLSILEPGFDAAQLYVDGGSGPLDFGWVHTARLGTFDTTRTVRVGFVSPPSHVAVARAYREYAKEQGFYRGLKDKLEECPSLEKLCGAVLVMLGYLHDPEADYLSVFRMLKARGIERAYVYPAGHFTLDTTQEIFPGYPWTHLDAAQREDLHRLGYLCAPWTWVNEMTDHSPFFKDSPVRTAVAKRIGRSVT